MRLWSNDRGLAAVEFVIVAPVLIVILGGVLGVGSLVQATAVVRNAAREGARYAAVGLPVGTAATSCAGTPSGVTAVVDCYLYDELGGRGDVQCGSVGCSGASVNVAYPSGQNVGQPVTVTVTFPVTVPLFGATTNVVSSATMEQLLVAS